MPLEIKEKQENQQTEEKKESSTQASENGLPKTQEDFMMGIAVKKTLALLFQD